MSIDEQLRQTFEALTDRLHNEVARELREASDAIVAAASADRDAAVAAASEAVAAAASEAAAAARAELEAAVVEARTAAAEEASAKIRAETTDIVATAHAETAQAVAAARNAEATAADAIEVAAAQARAELERVREEGAAALAAARADALQDADARVCGAVAEAEARARAGLERAREEWGASAQAAARSAQAGETASCVRLTDAARVLDRARSLSEVLDALVSCARLEASRVAVLIVRGTDLCGWRAAGFELAGTHDMDVPLTEAGVIGDAVHANRATTAAGPGAAPRFMALPEACECCAVPMALGGQVVAVLYADQAPVGDVVLRRSAHWAGAIEVLTRHAARCLEALTALQTARAWFGGDGRDDAQAAAPAAPPEGASDADNAARRYARLLVSEIKLYHEADVTAGRRERNLAARLGGEIDRARALYEQRVPAIRRQRTDYFHAELVRTLAGGDATLLD